MKLMMTFLMLLVLCSPNTDAITVELQRSLIGHIDEVSSVAFSSDGSMLASAGLDGTVQLWDIETGARIRLLTRRFAWIDSVAFSPDGRTLASGDGDGTVQLWDAMTSPGTEVYRVCSERSVQPGWQDPCQWEWGQDGAVMG